MTIYSTDTWTARTSDFLGHASRTLYEQLSGQWDVTYYTPLHLWTLGPPISHEGGPAAGKIISSASQLVTNVRRRMKPWLAIKTPQQFDALKKKSFSPEGEPLESWYGYLEAKVNSILPMEWFPAAFIPEGLLDKTRAWLNAAGFVGTLYPIQVSPEIHKAYDETSNMQSDLRDFWKLAWAKQVGELVGRTLPKIQLSA